MRSFSLWQSEEAVEPALYQPGAGGQLLAVQKDRDDGAAVVERECDLLANPVLGVVQPEHPGVVVVGVTGRLPLRPNDDEHHLARRRVRLQDRRHLSLPASRFLSRNTAARPNSAARVASSRSTVS